jgi:uncharacterized membrane protein YkoI
MRIERAIVAAGLMGLAACAGNKKTEEGTAVSTAQLSAPARSTVERVTAGGKIEKITKETERGRTVYDVEARVAGKHQEWLIAENDGTVLGTEVPVGFDELPAPVRAAAEKYFGTTSGLTAMKGVEYGETSYEIEGMKGGKKVEVTFDPTGKELKE